MTTPVARLSPKKRGTSRERIVEVSQAIIEDEGAEQLTIRRIADTIHRTQPAVYQHFESKDAILAAVVIQGFSALCERLERAAKGKKDSLTALAKAYVTFGLDRPNLYEVMFVGPPIIAFANPHETPMPAQTAFRMFATAVAEANPASDRIETVTETVWAALHGLVMLSITKRLRPGNNLHRARFEALTTAMRAMVGHR